MIEIAVNYWAVLVAAIANMAIGMLWYGPLFGKQWMAMTGITKESMKAMPMKPWQAMVGGLVTSLIIAYVLVFFTLTWVGSLSEALMSAFWIWLGFVATTQISGFLWEGKSFKLFVLNTAYSLVAYGVMAAILFLWQ